MYVDETGCNGDPPCEAWGVHLFRRNTQPFRLVEGFEAAEGRALQRSITAALLTSERADGQDVPDLLQIGHGSGDRLVVIWRNLVVGLVPPECVKQFDQVLADKPRAVVAVRGVVHLSGDLWRVWVGDLPGGGFPESTAHLDTLPAPEDKVLGIPIRRKGDRVPVWPAEVSPVTDDESAG